MGLGNGTGFSRAVHHIPSELVTTAQLPADLLIETIFGL
jgi:hypothetical protein